MGVDRGVRDWWTPDSRERVVWTGRPSPYAVRRGIGFAVGALLLGSVGGVLAPRGLQWATRTAVLAGVSVGAWTYLRYRGLGYAVTTRRVCRRSGVVGRSDRSIDLAQVRGTSVVRTRWQRLAGCGDVRIEVAGSAPLVLDSVTDPEEVAAVVATRLDREAATARLRERMVESGLRNGT